MSTEPNSIFPIAIKEEPSLEIEYEQQEHENDPIIKNTKSSSDETIEHSTVKPYLSALVV